MADKREIRPIVETRVLTEFGEVLDSPELYADAGAQGDLTYVPGYSDLRRKRDLEIAEVQAGKRDAKTVTTLPVRLQWARANRVSGEPDGTKPWEYANDGYRKAKKTDIGQDWLKELPPAAQVVAGGEIKMGDMTLMVCDQDRAAKNAARVKIQTQRQVNSGGAKLMAQGDRIKGSDPTYESKLADKPIGAE